MSVTELRGMNCVSVHPIRRENKAEVWFDWKILGEMLVTTFCTCKSGGVGWSGYSEEFIHISTPLCTERKTIWLYTFNDFTVIRKSYRYYLTNTYLFFCFLTKVNIGQHKLHTCICNFQLN